MLFEHRMFFLFTILADTHVSWKCPLIFPRVTNSTIRTILDIKQGILVSGSVYNQMKRTGTGVLKRNQCTSKEGPILDMVIVNKNKNKISSSQY